LYNLPDFFHAKFTPNPIIIPNISPVDLQHKNNSIVALGRLDSIKRPWIIGETARRLSEYDFYFLGQYHEERVKKIMEPYYELKNCHFLGHLEGYEKDKILREAKILINTSIHEAVPVSFLEALSYGLCLVSNRNPDNLTSEYGIYTGQINGEGFDIDTAEPFIKGIQQIMENDDLRIKIAEKGIEYIKTYHTIDRFVNDLRQEIMNAIT
jgi:glycosyltransferase involved in cell wall biosynthesis